MKIPCLSWCEIASTAAANVFCNVPNHRTSLDQRLYAHPLRDGKKAIARSYGSDQSKSKEAWKAGVAVKASIEVTHDGIFESDFHEWNPVSTQKIQCT